ncbi:hypothetical protein BN903_66 [Halorubrum sp. AJ67]|nr:hypothetical protein BN903_66 [Halorubrum sp. AJ67]
MSIPWTTIGTRILFVSSGQFRESTIQPGSGPFWGDYLRKLDFKESQDG